MQHLLRLCFQLLNVLLLYQPEEDAPAGMPPAGMGGGMPGMM